MITPVELKAIRQYFFLSPEEIAEEIGKTAEEWEEYEAGQRVIPDEVENVIDRLTRWRAKTAILSLDDMVMHDDIGPRAVLLWYARPEDMPGHVTRAQWRIYQSVYAEHVATARHILRARIVPFDADDYSLWLQEQASTDTQAARLAWARERMMTLYGDAVSPSQPAQTGSGEELRPL